MPARKKVLTSTDGRLAELKAWVQDGTLERAAINQQLGEELDKLIGLLTNESTPLKRLSNLLQAADLVVEANESTARRESGKLLDAGQKLLAAKTSEDYFEWKVGSWRDVDNASRTLELELREVWSRRCKNEFERHNQLGEIIAKFADTQGLGQRMIATAESGLKLVEKFPPSRKVLQAFAEGLSQRDKEVHELTETGGTEAVSELLLNIARGVATLNDVSVEVLGWVRDRGALNKFKIRLD